MITRDNYQEFFLLYADNELPAAERHEVERFVADHPDLRDEWEALLQCRLSPDTRLTFPDRESLLKPELEGSPYTGTLLSYLDGELDKEATRKIEAVIREQFRVANELAVLQQTISSPDPAIVFPDKDLLFRTEKERRIVPLPYIRAGIAAAIAGAIALILLLPATHRTPTSIADANAPAVPRTAPAVPHISPATAHNPPATSDNSPTAPHKNIPAVTSAPTSALHLTEAQPKTPATRPVRIIPQRKPQPQDVAAVDPKDVTPMVTRRSVDPVEQIDPVNVNRRHDPSTSVVIVSLPATGDLGSNVHPALQTGIPKDQSSFATLALQQQTDEDPAVARRPGLRGILRKVTRAFGKTADRDSDGNRQVLVGAFQVSLD